MRSFFSKTVQDYGNRLADICLVIQAVGQVGHSICMYSRQSLWVQLILGSRAPEFKQCQQAKDKTMFEQHDASFCILTSAEKNETQKIRKKNSKSNFFSDGTGRNSIKRKEEQETIFIEKRSEIKIGDNSSFFAQQLP